MKPAIHNYTEYMSKALTMATGWNDIDTSGPLDMGASACAVFSSLLALYMEVDKASVAVAVPMICLLGFRGNDKVIRPRDIPLVMALLQFFVDFDNNDFVCLGHLIALMLLGLGGNKLYSTSTWICPSSRIFGWI